MFLNCCHRAMLLQNRRSYLSVVPTYYIVSTHQCKETGKESDEKVSLILRHIDLLAQVHQQIDNENAPASHLLQ